MKDHRLVRIALFLFFVATSLVYAVFIQLRSDDVRKDVGTIVQKYGIGEGIMATGNQTIGSTSTGTTDVESGSSVDTGLTVDNEGSFFDEVLGTGKSQVLSGTELYYGTIDIFKKIGVRYEYILKDTTYDIFYAYIGSGKTYSVADLAKGIGGKTVEIYAKNDIINNLYFGERITFVELPGVAPTITSFFVRIGNDLWFIQDLSGQYKKHKRHIRGIFQPLS